MHLWYRLISQAVLTLNLLRTSNINPKLPAEYQLNGNFDYNITLLSSSGTAVLAHKNPSQQGSWSVHGSRGCYLGPAPNHYRCFEVYITKSGQTRIVDTVEFYPEKYKMPTLSTIGIYVKVLGIHRSAVPGGSPLTTKGPKYVTHHEKACSRGRKDSTRGNTVTTVSW